MSQYPLHDQLKARKAEVQTVGGFIDWMAQQGWVIAEYVLPKGCREERLFPVHKAPADIIGMFVNISRQGLEDEKRAMLDELRAAHEARETAP